jgi:hypothetical protein
LTVRTCAIVVLCAGCAVARTVYSAQPLGDPTQPSKMHSAAQSQPQKVRVLRLEGILCRGERRVAIIDGRIVHEGEHIANATIEKITADAVRYSRDGHDHTAQLVRTTLHVRQSNAMTSKLP